MNLNTEQMNFINCNESLVLTACPGSGKTTAISYKFYKLSKEWKASNAGIALLSFTNVAADEIENKIINISGKKANTGYPHFIGTIDSFYDYILRRFGYLLFGVTPNIVLEYGKIYRKSYCFRCNFKNWDSYFNINEDYVSNKDIVTCKENTFFCKKYAQNMLERGIVLQGSVPYLLKKLFDKYPKVVDIIYKRYPIIILDEAQDTSGDQAHILDLLLKHGTVINYVGDPDQSIYEWRNADSSYFKSKSNDNSFKQITFFRNNRSSQFICNATKRFGVELSKLPQYISDSIEKNFDVKPILIQYDSSTFEEVVYYFRKRVLQNGISFSKKTCAVIHSFKPESSLRFKDIYDDSNIFLSFYIKGVENYFIGSRKKAEEYFKNSLRFILFGNIESKNEKYEETGDLFDNLYNDFLKTIVLPNVSIAQWEAKTSLSINCFMEKYKIIPKVAATFKLKQRINGIPQYKQKMMSDLFCAYNNSECTVSTIHGVKGETFEAVLLFTREKSKVNGKTLCDQNIDTEKSRLAFVAMTRPKKILCVAVKNKVDYTTMFPKELWEYVSLK